MSAPGYSAPGPQRDPTAVMGTRCLAWLVDFLLYAALTAALFPPFSPLAEKTDLPEGMDGWDEACSEILPETEDARRCIPVGDTVYWTDDDDLIIQTIVPIAWFLLIFVFWQGLQGLTPGKALAGLRVVREDGRPPGIGKAFVRSLLWIVDGIPGVPLVGFICAASTPGHRRVGDMAAKTYVVRRADAGQPIQVPGVTPSYVTPTPGYASPPGQGAPTWGGAPAGAGMGSGGSGSGSPWPSSPPTAPAGPPTDPHGTPTTTTPWDATGGAAGWGTPPTAQQPTTTQQMPSAQQMPASPPGGMPSASPAAPGSPAAPAAPGAAGAPGTPSGETPSHQAPSPGAGSSVGDTADTAVTAVTPATDLPAGTAPTDAATAAGTAAGASPSDTTTGDTSAGAPSGEQPPSTPGAATQATGDAASGTAGTGGTGTTPSGQTYSPQWDAARGAYIQWDPNRGRWLQWDDTAKEWKVL